MRSMDMLPDDGVRYMARTCWETDGDGWCPQCAGDVKRCPRAAEKFAQALSSDRDPATMNDPAMD